MSNGTAALHCAYVAAGLQPGDEVIMPANTFVATANMALAIGARPVFCDIREDTLNIDEQQIESLITPKTKAIVPVHFAGLSCNMEAIAQIAKKHHLSVIEDACHALGGTYYGQPIGNCAFSHAAVFSFHPVKSITTGEGGAILTNDGEMAARMKRLRHHGQTKDPALMQQNDGAWYSEMVELGFNYRITDIQCALGSSQLARLPEMIAARERIAARYIDALSGMPGLTLPPASDNTRSSWHLFVIRVAPERRRAVFDALQAKGIGVQVHYIPVHRHPYYRTNGYADVSLPRTEQYYASCMSLPVYPDLSEQEQEQVIQAVKEVMNSYQ